mmetsp:Transcript_4539/g.11227  ORF Transcript_4539/g.11227 Transcript_4539/m.11227 type:complete len:272 (-) Transcript_4539:688-1503(-)
MGGVLATVVLGGEVHARVHVRAVGGHHRGHSTSAARAGGRARGVALRVAHPLGVHKAVGLRQQVRQRLAGQLLGRAAHQRGKRGVGVRQLALVVRDGQALRRLQPPHDCHQQPLVLSAAHLKPDLHRHVLRVLVPDHDVRLQRAHGQLLLRARRRLAHQLLQLRPLGAQAAKRPAQQVLHHPARVVHEGLVHAQHGAVGHHPRTHSVHVLLLGLEDAHEQRVLARAGRARHADGHGEHEAVLVQRHHLAVGVQDLGLACGQVVAQVLVVAA